MLDEAIVAPIWLSVKPALRIRRLVVLCLLVHKGMIATI